MKEAGSGVSASMMRDGFTSSPLSEGDDKAARAKRRLADQIGDTREQEGNALAALRNEKPGHKIEY